MELRHCARPVPRRRNGIFAHRFLRETCVGTRAIIIFFFLFLFFCFFFLFPSFFFFPLIYGKFGMGVLQRRRSWTSRQKSESRRYSRPIDGENLCRAAVPGCGRDAVGSLGEEGGCVPPAPVPVLKRRCGAPVRRAWSTRGSSGRNSRRPGCRSPGRSDCVRRGRGRR